MTGTFTQAGSGFDGGGGTVDIPDYRKFEQNAYLEYGLSDDVTALAQPQLRAVSIAAPTDADHVGLGYTDLGARMRIWSGDDAVLSGQALVRIPGAGDDMDPAQVGSTDFEADMRGLYGRSFSLGAWPAFIDAQLGYRFRAGDPADEIRADITFGVRPRPDFLLLAQSFNTVSVGSARGYFSKLREHKLQVSVVWDVSEAWSLQLGGVATVAGKNALAERGVVVGLWRRF